MNIENFSTPRTFIFIGRSGCGKGTQALLLKKYIEQNDSSKRDIFYLESGERFRDFIMQTNYTSTTAREIMKKGDLQPPFLAIHIWAHLFIEQMSDQKHLIIDGTPRMLDEAKVLDGAMTFYKREKPVVIFMNVSRDWAVEKLSARGRTDDDKNDIEKRLNWFEKEVMPTVEYLKNNPIYSFIEVNGEQTIEEVHQEILKSI